MFSQHGIFFKSVFYLIGSVLYLIEQHAYFQWQIDGLWLGCPRNYESSQTEKIGFSAAEFSDSLGKRYLKTFVTWLLNIRSPCQINTTILSMFWISTFYGLSKGQLILKKIVKPWILKTNECVFFRFLEESSAWQFFSKLTDL